MINDGISPDEINGLLGKKRVEKHTMSPSLLSQIEMEALTELLIVSLRSSTTVLSTLFSERVAIMSPNLSIKPKADVLYDVGSPAFVIVGQFEGGISGRQFLFINTDDAEIITQMVDTSSEVTNIEVQVQIVQEVVQQMFVVVSQSLSAVLDEEVSHSLLGTDVIENQQDFSVNRFSEEEWFVQMVFQLMVGNKINLTIYLCIPASLAKQMVGILTDSIVEGNLEEEGFQSMNQSNTTNHLQHSGDSPKIQPVQFSSFDESPSSHLKTNNLNMLFDIPLQVTVELGRTKRMVKDILEVSPGSIIELDKLAGEPVDILVNNKLIAVGEVVVIDENFGVRVTDIISTTDRISKLR